jgi:hypothetical protein
MLAPPRNGSLKIATGRYRSARPSSKARCAAVARERGDMTGEQHGLCCCREWMGSWGRTSQKASRSRRSERSMDLYRRRELRRKRGRRGRRNKDSRGKHQSSLQELDSYLIHQSSIPSTRAHQRGVYRGSGSLIVDLHLRRSRCLRVSSILHFDSRGR